jgi:hypothetical protein
MQKAVLSLLFATMFISTLHAQEMEPCFPEELLPDHITQLTDFGQRSEWSHDGERVFFVDKAGGEVFMVNVNTKETTQITDENSRPKGHGYYRVFELWNGDLLLGHGPERHLLYFQILDENLEFPAHDGRKLNGQALSFSVANRGADHMYGEVYPYEYPYITIPEEEQRDPSGLEGKAELVLEEENRNALLDSGVVCKFSTGFITEERLEELLDADMDDLLEVGAQIVELERRFNNERGFDREDDSLPYEDQLPGFEEALDEYYELRGWNQDGTVPGTGDAAPADD